MTTIELLKKYREQTEGELDEALRQKLQADEARGVKIDEQMVVPPAATAA